MLKSKLQCHKERNNYFFVVVHSTYTGSSWGGQIKEREHTKDQKISEDFFFMSSIPPKKATFFKFLSYCLKRDQTIRDYFI